MQRYNGNNIYNNKINIDFEKRSVKFEPIMEGKWGKLYVNFLVVVSLVTFYPFFFGFFLIYTFLYFFTGFDSWQMSCFGLLSCSSWICISLLTSLNFFRKKWKNEKYPEFNAYIIKILNIYKGKRTKWLEVNNKAIIHKQFIIPFFNNIELQYSVTEDYAKYLKKIDIVNKYKNNEYGWQCVFTFKKNPIKGVMKLLYV